MNGAYETCNHVIACLYKFDYENTKGFCNPSCTEEVSAWNQGTKKEVVPKRIWAELLVGKILAYSENKNVYKIPREEARMKDLSAFNPRIQSHKHINSVDISKLFH